MKILWAGPVVDRNCKNNNKAISPAGNSWQLDLIDGFRSIGSIVVGLTFIPYRIWPFGQFCINPRKMVNSNIVDFEYVCYTNIYKLRDFIIGFSYVYHLYRIFKNCQDIDILITYNTSTSNLILAKYFKKKHKNGIWVSIIADGYSKGNPDLSVFLSFGYFERSPLLRKLHLFGAASKFIDCSISNIPLSNIFYCGSLDRWSGIEEFVKYFVKIKKSKFNLHVYGKGDYTNLKRLTKGVNNVFLHGYVSNDILVDACKFADVFINPRPTDLAGIENNFPSKLLFYLRFGKPILSSKTLGISPIFNKLLFYYDPLVDYDFEKELNRIYDLSHDNLLVINKSAENFCKSYTWESQAKILIKELERIKIS